MTLTHAASMSLKEHNQLPGRESIIHSNTTRDEEVGQNKRRQSYRASTATSTTSSKRRSISIYPNRDEPNQSRQQQRPQATYDDEDVLDAYYDDMMDQTTPTTTQQQQREQVEKVMAGDNTSAGVDVSASTLAPALPERSQLRASRRLDAFHLKLDTTPTTLSKPTPQEVYLSSEEDASSSADEFSDYDMESESEGSERSSKARKSHETTAKIVSVVFVGKPAIVNLTSMRRSPSPPTSTTTTGPAATNISTPDRRQSRIASLSSTERSLRRSSVCSTSTSFSTQTNPNNVALPSNFSRSQTGSSVASSRPSFLSIDPYAGKTYHETVEENHVQERPTTPKTPTAMFKKGFSMVRKRTSRPHLKQGSDSSQISSESLTSASTLTLDQEVPSTATTTTTSAVNDEQQQPFQSPQPRSLNYTDMMRAAKKHARDSLQLSNPPTPTSTQQTPREQQQSSGSPAPSSTKRGLLSTFQRRRSIRA